jgi:TetR/AcrR family transcriptional regulator
MSDHEEAGVHHTENLKTPRDGLEADVFAAAIRIFAERGVDRAELSDIARAADTTLPVLERRYGSKENLFRSAVCEVTRGHVLRASTELPPGPAVERLRNFCGRSWEIFNTPTYVALEKLWATEIASDPDLARFYVEEVHGKVHGTLVAIIERGIADGDFRDVAAHDAARVILAALVTQSVWCAHSDAFGPVMADGCNRVVADTLSITLRGLQSPEREGRS